VRRFWYFRKRQFNYGGVVKKLLTVKQVAKLLNVTERTVYNWVEEKGLPCILVKNSARRFKPEDIEAWVDKQAVVN